MIDKASSTANSPNRAKGFWIEYGAALWAFAFAALHFVWAMGWYIGVDAESARKAFERRWFLIYDLIAAGLCFLAVALALALVQSWGRRLPSFLINVTAWTCAGVLALRGAAGGVFAVYLAAVGNSLSSVLSFWDLWFCLGAVLFAASIWRFRRTPV